MKPDCKEDDETCEKCSNDEAEGLKKCPDVPGPGPNPNPNPDINKNNCTDCPPPPPEVPCDIAKIKEENE